MNPLQDYNQCLAAPGLAIHGSGSTRVKYGNTFSYKAAGRLSGSVTTADAPALSGATLRAPYPNGTASNPGNLKDEFYRIYTLVGTLPVNGTETITPTYSWLCSADFDNTLDVVNLANAVMPDKSNQCAIGFVIINNETGADFVPDTTALDASNLTVTYYDNYAINVY